MFAWPCLYFSAIPVSISAVSSTGRQTWQNVKVSEDCKEFKIHRKRKAMRKKRYLAAFVIVPSFCKEKSPTAEF
jgi:hypothetical protein